MQRRSFLRRLAAAACAAVVAPYMELAPSMPKTPASMVIPKEFTASFPISADQIMGGSDGTIRCEWMTLEEFEIKHRPNGEIRCMRLPELDGDKG